MSMNHNPSPGSSAAPVCPRHPDRTSYVRCQRCDRPVCYECQRPAAVGVQCVDCVNAAKKTIRPARSALGATIRDSRPVVTFAFIGLCVVSFILQFAMPGWTEQWIFWPYGAEHEPYRFLTAAFLHSTNLTHILFNMYALWVTGQFLEPMLGRAKFITLFILSAIGGSVAVLLFASPLEDSWFQGVLGASGAVFGLFGAILVVLRRLKGNANQILILLVINFALGFIIPNISWQAHLGGLVVGALLGLAFAYAPQDKRRLAGVAAPAVVGVVLIVLAMMKYALV